MIMPINMDKIDKLLETYNLPKLTQRINRKIWLMCNNNNNKTSLLL